MVAVVIMIERHVRPDVVVLLHEARTHQVIDDARQVQHFEDVRFSRGRRQGFGNGVSQRRIIRVVLPLARFLLEPCLRPCKARHLDRSQDN